MGEQTAIQSEKGTETCGNRELWGIKCCESSDLWKNAAVGTETLVATKSFGNIELWEQSCGNREVSGNKELWEHGAVGTESLVGTKSFGNMELWGQKTMVGTKSF